MRRELERRWRVRPSRETAKVTSVAKMPQTTTYVVGAASVLCVALGLGCALWLPLERTISGALGLGIVTAAGVLLAVFAIRQAEARGALIGVQVAAAELAVLVVVVRFFYIH